MKQSQFHSSGGLGLSIDLLKKRGSQRSRATSPIDHRTTKTPRRREEETERNRLIGALPPVFFALGGSLPKSSSGASSSFVDLEKNSAIPHSIVRTSHNLEKFRRSRRISLETVRGLLTMVGCDFIGSRVRRDSGSGVATVFRSLELGMAPFPRQPGQGGFRLDGRGRDDRFSPRRFSRFAGRIDTRNFFVQLFANRRVSDFAIGSRNLT